MLHLESEECDIYWQISGLMPLYSQKKNICTYNVMMKVKHSVTHKGNVSAKLHVPLFRKGGRGATSQQAYLYAVTMTCRKHAWWNTAPTKNYLIFLSFLLNKQIFICAIMKSHGWFDFMAQKYY